ncbi:hypothetical protein KY285_007559 [Solanum tuberosum]|nr:hypothetical protein KY285_007559 [Solanum tuberosum]
MIGRFDFWSYEFFGRWNGFRHVHIQLVKHNVSFSAIGFTVIEQTSMLDLLALEDVNVLKKIKMET